MIGGQFEGRCQLSTLNTQHPPNFRAKFRARTIHEHEGSLAGGVDAIGTRLTRARGSMS